MVSLMMNWFIPNMITETMITTTATMETKKVMYTSYGDVEFEISHNKNGEYEPKEIRKYQNTIPKDKEEYFYISLGTQTVILFPAVLFSREISWMLFKNEIEHVPFYPRCT